jgi:hypothetical protein
MVAPERCGAGGFYALFIQTEANGGPAAVSALRRAAQEIEAALRSNPQYAHCLRLGQLGPLRVFRITGGAAEDFLASCAARGQRLGDIKPPALHPRPGWTAVFRGELLS